MATIESSLRRSQVKTMCALLTSAVHPGARVEGVHCRSARGREPGPSNQGTTFGPFGDRECREVAFPLVDRPAPPS